MEADMSLISLISRASTLVQLVMLALLAASVLSWDPRSEAGPARSRRPSSVRW